VSDHNAVDPYFVALFLNSSLGRMQSLRLISGGVLGHVMPNSVKRLFIALPSFEIQLELGERLRTVESHREIGRALVTSAQADVEALIAGTLDIGRLLEEGREHERWIKSHPAAFTDERTHHARST
jgi:restriction endonuclease S subunit